jgi:alkaline phosphatase D
MGRRSSNGPGGYSRREFLQRAGAGLAATPLLGCGSSGSLPGGLNGGVSPFRHGVASGDPLADRVILWTRVTPPAGMEGDIPATLTLADDPELRVNPRTLAVTAVAERDWTIKHDADGLVPGKTYYYRFSALGFDSPVGRTRTANQDGQRLRMAVVSCSNYPVGFFNAYRFIGERADLDVVLHLGDYLYAGGGAGSLGRAHEPRREILLLEDYRERHAQYKADPDLQLAHRQHPWITVWDDHESTNNSRRDSAQNHTEGPIEEGGEGIWQVRKAIAQRAYDEWMPIRLPTPGDPNKIWRRFSFGSLMDLWMLDTRLFDRDDELGINDPGNFDPERRLLGPEQRDWLLSGLSTSTATWKFLGQQVMFGQLKITPLPDVPLPAMLVAFPVPLVLASGEGLTDVYINPDQWDGYQAERLAILDHLANESIDNAVVLTGDIHTSWVMDLTPDPENLLMYSPLTGAGSRGVEFVATSVTSTGLEELPAAPLVAAALPLLNPHMRYVELTRRGYLLMDLTPEETVGEYWYVSTVAEPGGTQAFATAYATVAGSNRVSRLPRFSPTPEREDAPPLAP